MRLSANRAIGPWLLLVSVAIGIPLPHASAQDEGRTGPIREFLKQRRQKQEADKPTTPADPLGRISKPGDYTFSFEHAGLSRSYRVHVPPSYNAAEPTPLLVSLHGGGAHMEYQANDENYGQISKSDREGFIVVFPNGYSKLRSGKLATWNAGSCCAWARDANIDDVGFIGAMIERLGSQLSIDRRKIFATGISNGGMLAYRLACELPGTIRAVASVAGTLGVTECRPKEPVPVLHIHAKNDDHVLFGGGAGPKAQSGGKVPQFMSVPETVSRWIRVNRCNDKPTRVLDKAGAYCDRYSQCDSNAPVQLCVTESGGHSWPGASKSRGEPTSKAISANDVMWDFFNGR